MTGGSMQRLIGLGACIFLSTWTMNVAHAQRCCSALADDEFGVLHWEDKAQLTVSTTTSFVLGGYDNEGRFQPDGRGGLDMIARAGGGVRPGHRDLQFYGWMPFGLSYRPDMEEGAWGLGPGDYLLGFRWTILRDLKIGIQRGISSSRRPFVDLYLESAIPTSRRESGSSPADMIEARAGVRASKYFTYRDVISGFAQIGAASGSSVMGAGLSFERIDSMTWSYGVSAELASREILEEAGLSISGFLHHRFAYPDWRLTGRVGTDWFGPIGGIDRAAVGPAVEVGVSRIF